MSNLPENLKLLRTEHNMTQSELAEKIYASVQSISRWETGESEPSLDMICSICNVFEVSTDRLIGNSTITNSTIIRQVSDYIASETDFAEKSFEICKCIPCGRIKRLSAQIGCEITLGNYHAITDRKGLNGIWSDKPEYPRLFALADVERFEISETDTDTICSVFSYLSNKDNIAVLLKCQDLDGWYDAPSLLKLLDCSNEKLESILIMLKCLGMLHTKNISVNNCVKMVYAIDFTYKIKLLLALSTTVFTQKKCSYIW